ncbi:MAG: malate synthase A [Saprospiraceae bacterium]|nr:malate synthase A [Saprospiraceae bacterium]
MNNSPTTTARITVKAPLLPGFETILTPGALDFLSALHEHFAHRRLDLLDARETRQQHIDAGEKPVFPPETAQICEEAWTVAPIPADLQDRRVEITGPVERKMIINALNSGASTFMADLEDSLAPTWENAISGQINLRDAVRRTIAYDDPASGKSYNLNEKTAVLLVRPRGWHLEERHLSFMGRPCSGSLTDFGLYFFHNAHFLLKTGSGPYFYLPKLENAAEARLWNDVFVFSQNYLGIPQGSIRATVLVETILASFELDEILWELRDHAAGLNCGRWDYIFSFIKKFRNNPAFVLPDRGRVTMTTPFMRAYALRVIQVCHRRGCHAIGGMAAQIPVRGDVAANDAAFEKVRQDKLREVTDGHDGTWVAHPGLVPVAKAIFDEYMPQPNQIAKQLTDITIKAADLLEVPTEAPTETGVRQNINVGLLYVESWLRGQGCVALYNLMEDAATAEISRTQLWQWLHHGVRLADGRFLTVELYQDLKTQEIEKIRGLMGEDTYKKDRFDDAEALFDRLILDPHFEEFLTLPAYQLID